MAVGSVTVLAGVVTGAVVVLAGAVEAVVAVVSEETVAVVDVATGAVVVVAALSPPLELPHAATAPRAAAVNRIRRIVEGMPAPCV